MLGWLVFALAGQVLPAGAAELELAILDESHKPMPARVRIRDATGRDRVPSGAQVVKIAHDRWFVTDGVARLKVPAGGVEVRVEHGTEYSPIKQTIEVSEAGPTRQELTLHRWIDMAERGYVSGENHLHVAIAELGPQLVAEGLDIGNSLQWWNGPRWPVPPGDGWSRVLQYAGRGVPTSIQDVEIEYEWGAVYIVGLREPLTAKADPKRPNLPVVRAAHAAGALVCYQGGYSREVLLDALLGCVDVVNVCNNNFHRHRFQPRSRYSNLLGVAGFPVYPDTPEGMMRLSTDTYYRLLNCGLKLAAGAESATGAKPSPVGYNRAYVRTTRSDDPAIFLEAWRRGRNLVTNGPMLFLRLANGAEPGDTVISKAGEMLRVEVLAQADQPITSLEVVVNGVCVPATPQLQGHTARLALDVPLSESCWIAARCTEEDMLLSDAEMAAYNDGDSARGCRLRFAHTSPIYVSVEGKPVRVEAAIAEARQMLDGFEVFAKRQAAEPYQAELLDALRIARKRLAAAE